jgi:hypothetical protein
MTTRNEETGVDINHETIRKGFFVAFETLNHKYFLEEFDLPNGAKDQMLVLRQWHRDAVGRRQLIAESLLCKKLCIKIGTLGVSLQSRQSDRGVPELTQSHQPCPAMPQHDLEALRKQTQFQKLERHDMLTDGFRQPLSLADAADSITATISSCSADKSAGQARHALVVSFELDRTRAFWAMVASAVLGLCLGIGMGVKHDVTIGAAVGAAVFGFIALIQTAVVWKYR